MGNGDMERVRQALLELKGDIIRNIVRVHRANMEELTERLLIIYGIRKRSMKPFTKKVFEVVQKIPAGETMTYGEVAAAAGKPGAARAVGNILSTNYDPAIPCHRVVRSDGKPGGYNRGAEIKIQKLITEKAAVVNKV